MPNYPYPKPGVQLDEFREFFIQRGLDIEKDFIQIMGLINAAISDVSNPNAELAAMRQGSDGTTYQTSGERLQAEIRALVQRIQETDSELKEQLEPFIGVEDMPDGQVFLSAPADPRNIVFTATATTITLLWQESPTRTVQKYAIYVNGNKKGESSETTYKCTGLARNTTYTIKVAAIGDTGGESAGTTITAKTEGNQYLKMTGGGNRIEISGFTFATIGIDCYLEPRAESWSNVIITTPDEEYLLGTQYNGESYRFWGFTHVYINDVELLDDYYGIIPARTRQTIKLDLEDPMTEFYIFADYEKNSTMQGKIYGVTIYDIGDDGELYIKGFYDFTYGSTGGTVLDKMGNLPPISFYGATFATE